MTDKVLLFVDDSESFITKSIMKNVEGNGHAVKLAHLDVDELAEVQGMVDGYIFYNIADVAKVNSMGLAYLRDMALEHGYTIYFMGYEDDIAQISADFPKSYCGSFTRPINVMQVSEDIEAIVQEVPAGARQKHILVVDDSGVMLNTMKEWLENSYRVSLVNSATNGISFLATNKPDLILLDYEMPICDGPQFMEMIRSNEDTAHIPVIFLTGKDDADSVKRVLALKPAGYILKSSPKEEILSTIADYFRKTVGIES